MCGRRSEAVYIADMVSACERMLVFASGRQPDELLAETLPHRGAILHELVILGEAARYVTPERRAQWATFRGKTSLGCVTSWFTTITVSTTCSYYTHST